MTPFLVNPVLFSLSVFLVMDLYSYCTSGNPGSDMERGKGLKYLTFSEMPLGEYQKLVFSHFLCVSRLRWMRKLCFIEGRVPHFVPHDFVLLLICFSLHFSS